MLYAIGSYAYGSGTFDDLGTPMTNRAMAHLGMPHLLNKREVPKQTTRSECVPGGLFAFLCPERDGSSSVGDSLIREEAKQHLLRETARHVGALKKRIGERALRIVQAKDRHLGLARRPRTRRRIRLAPTSEDSSAAFRSHVSSADGRPLRFQACATQTRTPPECRLGTNRSN